ncbi:MSMEG_0567/sll0787 family protein [Subtercola boreus]|uniref:AIR synthase n=1 Tax=Subtercola boreus TaxID=120213 RepID=A0A3E0WCF8_9MICO|nr:MSMEG_0567/sll0787 family protein [Subtercola boreus]RFA21055.1 AIR synthase [Subtercola boreus]RFA21439.1 AIR synthase [Subtercola boreus]RFA27410.1 AIR synthase [Subtercola boreus]
MSIDVPFLMGSPRTAPHPAAPVAFLIHEADAAEVRAYRVLRRETFVEEQQLFDGHDLDELDLDERTVVLVARAADGTVLGGVRLSPAIPLPAPDLGWWTGSRLVVARAARGQLGIGAALVKAACAHAEARGVLRFEATVQPAAERMFAKLGWERLGETTVAGVRHARVRWPIGRVQRASDQAKAHLEALLDPFGGWTNAHPLSLGGPEYVGDDGAPVPGTDVIAACDAILPAMVERDPEWAGWCAILVNLNDISAMGAEAVGVLDSLGARDASFARRIMSGLRAATEAWGVPVLGGHTQLGVPASLSVTALGRTAHPVRGGGARAGHALTVTADLSGGWRRGYDGSQWDSTSGRTGAELRALGALVPTARPAAAKDVSMAGLVGTVGMMAEASGVGAELYVAEIPRPGTAGMADWLTCFPGFGMVTADAPGAGRMGVVLAEGSGGAAGSGPGAGVNSRGGSAGHPPLAVSAECGTMTHQRGVRLRWPDGDVTTVVDSTVTGLGRA